MKSIRKKVKEAGGCKATVCFALDGSGAIPLQGFINERNFALDVVSVIAVDEKVELSAVQYASHRHVVSTITTDASKFVLATQNEKQSGGKSFTAGGIALCSSLLRKSKSNARKIVLFTDGKTSVGRNAAWRAELFRFMGGDLSVVEAGVPDRRAISAIAGFNKNRLFNVKSFLDVLALQNVIEQLVFNICELGGGKAKRRGHWLGGRKWGTSS